jgi:hypothetical protein
LAEFRPVGRSVLEVSVRTFRPVELQPREVLAVRPLALELPAARPRALELLVALALAALEFRPVARVFPR